MSKSELVHPARLVPDVLLRDASGVSDVPVRSPGAATCGVLVHGLECDGCRAYLASLGEIAELRGEVRVILPCETGVDQTPTWHLRLLLDLERHVSRALNLEPPAWFVADHWGAVVAAASAGDVHGWTPPATLVEWLDYTKQMCPECQGEAL